MNIMDILVKDLGNGLCARIRSDSSTECAVLDCGSSIPAGVSTAETALAKWDPETFVLSHFHLDHYSGLAAFDLKQPSTVRLGTEQVFYPRLPDVSVMSGVSSAFLRAMFCMSDYELGGDSGTPLVDFASIFERRTSSGFTLTPLAEGDRFILEGISCEVLWPPKTASAKEISRMGKAIRALETLLKNDPVLRNLYEKYAQRSAAYQYERKGKLEQNHKSETINYSRQQRVLGPEHIKVNKLLAGVANDLSLAFMAGDQLLFLGDLEKSQIRQVMAKLEIRKALRFDVLFAPHHGTHWHDSLTRLKVKYCLSSVGTSLLPKWNTCFKNLAEDSQVTHTNGDLYVCLDLSARHRRFVRHTLFSI